MTKLQGEGKYTMGKKCYKILIMLLFFGFTLLSSNLHAENISNQELKQNIVVVNETHVLTKDKAIKNTASSHVKLWGLGAALIGFVFMSQRRGI